MTSKLARFLVAALLLGLAKLASASITAIDLSTVSGVPGTGGHSTIVGPCYCDQDATFSPVILLQPGSYDFGEVRDYWVRSGYTPDGGPDQANLYLLFSPLVTYGNYPDDFAPPPTSAFPSNALCSQDDVACNAKFIGAFMDTDLVFTILPGQDAIQIGLVGSYRYTPPVPEPLPLPTLVLGLAVMGGIAARRGRR